MPKDQLKLWNSFDIRYRAVLWNALGFPLGYFKKLTRFKNKVFTKNEEYSFDYFQSLRLLHPHEFYELAEIIVGKEKPNFQFKNLNSGSFKSHKATEPDDFRSQLWFPLSLKEKFIMFLYTEDSNDAALISMMILAQLKFIKKGETEILQWLDSPLECTLNNLMYERYFVKI